VHDLDDRQPGTVCAPEFLRVTVLHRPAYQGRGQPPVQLRPGSSGPATSTSSPSGTSLVRFASMGFSPPSISCPRRSTPRLRDGSEPGPADIAEKTTAQTDGSNRPSQRRSEAEFKGVDHHGAFGERRSCVSSIGGDLPNLTRSGFPGVTGVVYNSFMSRPRNVWSPADRQRQVDHPYSSLKQLARGNHIITVEDPRGWSIGVQSDRGPAADDVTFSTILRNILRQDPDCDHDRRDPRS
jgi:hypothetical protein